MKKMDRILTNLPFFALPDPGIFFSICPVFSSKNSNFKPPRSHTEKNLGVLRNGSLAPLSRQAQINKTKRAHKITELFCILMKVQLFNSFCKHFYTQKLTKKPWCFWNNFKFLAAFWGPLCVPEISELFTRKVRSNRPFLQG